MLIRIKDADTYRTIFQYKTETPPCFHEHDDITWQGLTYSIKCVEYQFDDHCELYMIIIYVV